MPLRLPFCALVLAGLATSGLAAGVSHFAPLGKNLRVHYESYGEGREALVFIHGWTCDLTFWRAQEPVYTSHRALLVDLPGHGMSSSPVIPYPSDMMARGVEAAMRDAGVDKAILVGHSLGGPVAFAFLRQFPDKVKAVVLVDAYVTPPAAPIGSIAVRNARVAQARARLSARDRSLRGPAGGKRFRKEIERMFSDRTTDELREQILKKMLATPEHVRASAVTSVSGLPPAKVGLAFDIPALAIQNASRGVEARYHEMQSVFPRLTLDKWEGYGHFLMIEDPARFNQALEDFLATMEGGPPGPHRVP